MPISRVPTGKPGLNSFRRISEVAPVFGSSLPRNNSPKFVYQTWPLLSRITSCGSMVGRGRSYSVISILVERPVGRSKVLSGYSHWEDSLRLIDARNSADLRKVSGLGAHSGSIRFCGLIGWLTWA